MSGDNADYRPRRGWVPPRCSDCGRDHSPDPRSAIACSVAHRQPVPGLTCDEAAKIAAAYEKGRRD